VTVEADVSSEDLLHLEVPCNRDAPCVVRDALGELEEISQVRDDARLIASELVTNAVVHSRCSADQTIAVSAKLGEGCVTISVDDPGLAGKTAEISSDPYGQGGFGLRIVEKLARRWGVARPNGHLVWAELALG
jgi:anti-sigma regulatory factor (Ser/Thr protein kinase)